MVKMSHNFRILCFICSLNQTNLHISIQIVHLDEWKTSLSSCFWWKNERKFSICYERGNRRGASIIFDLNTFRTKTCQQFNNQLYFLCFHPHNRLQYSIRTIRETYAHEARAPGWDGKSVDSLPFRITWCVLWFSSFASLYIHWVSGEEMESMFGHDVGNTYSSSQHRRWSVRSKIKTIKNTTKQNP